MVNVPWDIDAFPVTITRHFSTKYMGEWHWTRDDLKEAILHAYRIDKAGTHKYEIYVNKKGFKKIIVIVNEGQTLCITGSQGGGRA